MYIHALNPVLINFGFIEIRWYSLAYIFGILIGWWFANKIIIFKCKPYKCSAKHRPGFIFNKNDSFFVKCKTGGINLLEFSGKINPGDTFN